MSAVLDVIPKGLTKEVQRNLSRSTLIEGARSADWWATQSATVQNKFMRTVRLGIENGESASVTAARITGGVVKGETIKGFMDVSRHQARTLVRQSTAEVANAARLESFRANSDVLRGMQQLSTFDDKTTEICVAYSGATWDLDGEPMDGTTLPFNDGPPRHWNCRSVLIPVVKSFDDLGLRGPDLMPGTRASLNGQVAADLSFDKWLRTQSKALQNQLLGKTKAELFRGGNLALKDLVNVAGQAMETPAILAKIQSTGYGGWVPGSKQEAIQKFFDANFESMGSNRQAMMEALKTQFGVNRPGVLFTELRKRSGLEVVRPGSKKKVGVKKKVTTKKAAAEPAVDTSGKLKMSAPFEDLLTGEHKNVNTALFEKWFDQLPQNKSTQLVKEFVKSNKTATVMVDYHVVNRPISWFAESQNRDIIRKTQRWFTEQAPKGPLTPAPQRLFDTYKLSVGKSWDEVVKQKIALSYDDILALQKVAYLPTTASSIPSAAGFTHPYWNHITVGVRSIATTESLNAVSMEKFSAFMQRRLRRMAEASKIVPVEKRTFVINANLGNNVASRNRELVMRQKLLKDGALSGEYVRTHQIEDALNDFLTFIHELGHQVHFRSTTRGDYMRDMYSENIARATNTRLSSSISKYGASNQAEFYAEQFSFYVLDREGMRRWNSALVDHFDDILGRSTKAPGWW